MKLTSSTTRMLSVLGNNEQTGELPLGLSLDALDTPEKQLQLTHAPSPSLSMEHILAQCFNLKDGNENTPLS